MTDKTQNGFNVLELILVIGLVGIILAIGINFTSKIFQRRSIDNISYKIGSLLNLSKLQATRQGLEYQITLEYDETNKLLILTNERGDSNRNSSIYSIINSHKLKIPKDYMITLPRNRTTHSFNFNPNGTLGGASGSIRIIPLSHNSKISKCGRIVVSPFGRIRTVIGNWDFATSSCKGFGDKQNS